MQEAKALLSTKLPLDDIVRSFTLPAPVYITQPNLPDLAGFNQYLRKIWDSRWLTNDGQFHQQFEQCLKQHLQLEYLNLFNNGTIALLVALQALRINSGQVITTPFTFPASSHVLYWLSLIHI